MDFVPREYVCFSLLNGQSFSNGAWRGFESAWPLLSEDVTAISNTNFKWNVFQNPDCRGVVVPGVLPDGTGKAGVPVVNYSNHRGPLSEAINIFTDDDEIGGLAASHLAALGYRKFCFLGINNFAFSQDRLRGFQSGLKSYGFKARACWLDKIHTPHPIIFQEEREKLFGELLRKSTEPVGLFCQNDETAASFLLFLAKTDPDGMGRFGIVGVDDQYGPSPPPSKCPIPLSTILPDFESAGKRCAEELCKAIGAGKWTSGAVIRIPGARLIERDSSGGMGGENVFIVRLSRRIHQLIEAGESPRVGLLAGEFNTSPRTLLNRFKSATGHNLRETILKERLQRATRLLQDQSLSIAEIAYACGFDKQGSLSMRFKNLYGCTPKEFRKRL